MRRDYFFTVQQYVTITLYLDCQLHFRSVRRLTPNRASAANFFQPANQIVHAVTGRNAAIFRRRRLRRAGNKAPAIILDDKAEAGRLHFQQKTYLRCLRVLDGVVQRLLDGEE